VASKATRTAAKLLTVFISDPPLIRPREGVGDE
jgi:hypothetical protein